MKEDFDYKEVPKDYPHCFDADCARSANCLRFQIGLLTDKGTPFISIVNPKYVADHKECPCFQPDEPMRYASGITHLYDELPHTKYRDIKNAIHHFFGHNQYYQVYNKLALIKPEEQAFIRDLFVKEGIGAEPLFDEYIEWYDFFPSKK